MSYAPIQDANKPAQDQTLLWVFGALSVLVLSLRIPPLFSGVLADTDDMMRLQQVRDLLAGQSWFVVDQARMLTPEGGDMHWSRLPDIFMAGTIMVLEPLFGTHAAEVIAIGVWPLVLFAALIGLLFTAMDRLGINPLGQLCGLLCFVSSTALFNFWPGRIDHRGFVVVLIVAGFAALVSKRLSQRSAVILALCITAALSVAIEALPYACALTGLAGLFWVMRGHIEGPRLATLGLCLIVFSSLFYAFDAPGFSDRRLVCDAYGWSHWLALLVAGGWLTALGVFGGMVSTWQQRLILGLIAAGTSLAVFATVNPSCFADPYAMVPDSVRESWLSSVSETLSLAELAQTRLNYVLWLYGFIAVAIAAAILMIMRAKPEHRLVRVSSLIMLLAALVLTIWQLRGQAFSHTFAVISAGWLMGSLFDTWRERRSVPSVVGLAVGALCLMPVSWRMAGDVLFTEPRSLEESGSWGGACLDPVRLRALSQTPIMHVHTPIDLGPLFLMHTPHNVFVGPYHRNITGIERANLVLIGPAQEAQQRLLDMGATHLAFCVGLSETDRYGLNWPNGLAARLNQGDVPDWLEPVDPANTEKGTLRLFRISNE